MSSVVPLNNGTETLYQVKVKDRRGNIVMVGPACSERQGPDHLADSIAKMIAAGKEKDWNSPEVITILKKKFNQDH